MGPFYELPDPEEGCNRKCCNGFWRTEHLYNVQQASLTNDIHPIFQADRFAENTHVDHSLLEMSCRAASLFLEELLPFFHTIFFARVRRLPEHHSQPVRLYEYCEDEANLDAQQEANVRARLLDLARIVKFMFERMNQPWKKTESSCQMQWKAKIPDTSPFRDGKPSIIWIAPAWYNAADLIVRKPSLDVVFETATLITLSKSMIHELAHAAMAAALKPAEGRKYGAFFFPGSEVAEEGWEDEKRLFGDIECNYGPPQILHNKDLHSYTVNDVPSGTRSMFTCLELWNRNQVNHYTKSGFMIAFRGFLPVTTRFWNVEFGEIHRLFQASFWAERFHQPREARPHLLLTRRTGIIAANSTLTDNFRQAKLSDVSEPLFVDVVPRGYRVEPSGFIRPKDFFAGDDDSSSSSGNPSGRMDTSSEDSQDNLHPYIPKHRPGVPKASSLWT